MNPAIFASGRFGYWLCVCIYAFWFAVKGRNQVEDEIVTKLAKNDLRNQN